MRWPAYLIVASLLLSPMAVDAVQVTLKNGDVIEGELLDKNTSTSVKVRTLKSVLSIPRANVLEIRESAPGAIDLMKGKDALTRGQLDEASRFCEAAEKAGAELKAVLDLRGAISKARAAAELKQYSDLLDTARAGNDRAKQDAAIAEVERLFKAEPADSPFRKELLEILSTFYQTRAKDARDRVRNDEAAKSLLKIIELDPNRPEPHIGLGDLYRAASGTWPAAVGHYSSAIRLGEELDRPTLTRAHWEIAEIHRQQKKWKEAASYYRFTYQRDPKFNIRLADRYMEAMRAFIGELREPQPAGALMVIDEALKVRREADLLALRGEVLATLERWDESTASMQEAIKLSPKERLSGAHLRIAQNQMAKGETLSARESLQKEVASFPNNYLALCMLADDAVSRDDLDAAEKNFTEARRVEPTFPRATLGLSRVNRQKKNLERAKQFAQEVLDRAPDDRAANLEMGNILLDDNKLEDARKYFTSVLDLVDTARTETTERRKLAELDTLKADALLARGGIGLQTSGPGTASQDFLKALEVIPDYPQAYYAIGKAYQKRYQSSKLVDDLKESETNMIKARKLLPQNPQYALDLGILYSEQLAQADAANNKDYLAKAKANWEDYIELGGADTARVRAWIKEIGE